MESAKTTEKKKLIYDEEFKKWIRENPGAIKVFKELVNNNFFKENSIFEDKNLRIELLFKKGESLYFKISSSQDSFFVKILNNDYLRAKGFDEYNSALKVKKVFEEDKDVELIESQLGYQDDKRSYYVSKWANLPTVLEHLRKLDKESNEYTQIKQRTGDIFNKLVALGYDSGLVNMFYNADGNKIIIFDL